MDKREIADIFRQRLRALIARKGENLSQFADRCGLDRSALSQFLAHGTTRLPRAETLTAIAAGEGVSVDWLLGISQSETGIGEVAPMFGIEVPSDADGQPVIDHWHREATGYKIRYIPSSLPDLLRTDAVIKYEFSEEQRQVIDAKAGQSQNQLNYSRRPETDIETVMPRQRLEEFAGGTGVWSGLTRGARQAQLEHMCGLLDELYPTFRLFLYDARRNFSAPFTVFGPKRAAVYLGDMYLVVNSVDHIRTLTARFDDLIRQSEVGPDRTAEFVAGLKVA